MKMVLAALITVMGSSAFAEIVTNTNCSMSNSAGQNFTLRMCQGEDQSIIACLGSDVPAVEIVRYTSLGKNAPEVVETVALPGFLFTQESRMESVVLRMNNPIAGTLEAEIFSDNVDSSIAFTLPSMAHQFRRATCAVTAEVQ